MGFIQLFSIFIGAGGPGSSLVTTSFSMRNPKLLSGGHRGDGGPLARGDWTGSSVRFSKGSCRETEGGKKTLV